MSVPAGMGPLVTRGADTGALAQTLAGFDLVPGRIEIRYGLPGPGSGEQWLSCAEVLDDPAGFDHWRKRLADWLADRHGGSIPERTTSGYLMSWYLQVPGFLAGLLFHTSRRVPSLHPRDLAFRLSDGRPHPDGIAVLSDKFACLPEDPDSHRAEATTVADDRALAAMLRARYIAHAAKFVTAFGRGTRLGRRMLWAAATDALDSSGWLAGRTRGDERAGVADSALLLPPTMEEPLTSASTLRAVSDELGRMVWTRRRESCCFHFALPNQAACVTCPRTSDEERAVRALHR